MFHWDRGLFITTPRLGLDIQRRQPHGFVSHAHADHLAAHQRAYCTAETARLYRHRLGEHRQTVALNLRVPYQFGDAQLTAYPAGHCLGSAMLLVQRESQSLLYTGDFKLGDSATAERAELPRADILVMESTFGRPRYRLPPRADVVAALIELVQTLLADGKTPVIHAYQLGKSQEASRLLTDAGIRVLQHPSIYAISRIYQQCGVDLGDVQPFDPQQAAGAVIVTLPKQMPGFRLPGIVQPESIALTGWAVDPATRFKWKVDHALPLSDHADYDELMQAAAAVDARRIFCTHGPAEFVDHLRAAGFDARPVTGSYQTRLF